MTNKATNPDQLRDRATSNQQQLLEQYAQLIEQNTEQATIQAVNDQLTHYELMGIQRGYQSAKKQVVGMMQDKLNALNAQNSEKIIQMRADLPELPPLDEELGLEAPSLQEAIDHAHRSYGVLTSGEDNSDLPDDLQNALEA